MLESGRYILSVCGCVCCCCCFLPWCQQHCGIFSQRRERVLGGDRTEGGPAYRLMFAPCRTALKVGGERPRCSDKCAACRCIETSWRREGSFLLCSRRISCRHADTCDDETTAVCQSYSTAAHSTQYKGGAKLLTCGSLSLQSPFEPFRPKRLREDQE